MMPIPDDLQAALGTLDSFQQARLGHMLTTLGEDRVRRLVAEAQQIQATEGMQKPTGEPQSTMGIVGILVRASARPEEVAAIFGPYTFVPLDSGLLGPHWGVLTKSAQFGSIVHNHTTWTGASRVKITKYKHTSFDGSLALSWAEISGRIHQKLRGCT